MAGSSGLEWCYEEFANIELGDKRLNERIVMIAASLLVKPETSLTQAVQSPTGVRAMGRFFASKRFGYEEILEPHLERTFDRMSRYQEVLLVQDSSHLNYSSHKATKDLGHIGTSHNIDHQGIMMHSALALSPAGQSLGLAFQKFWTRDVSPSKTKKNSHQTIPYEEKESFKWVEALREVDGAFEGAMNRPRLIWLADREADIYEHIAELSTLAGHSYVIRANCNRVVESEQHLLWQTLESQKPQGTYTLTIKDRHGKSREATLSVRIGPLHLKAQRRKGKANTGKLPDIKVNGVLVQEDSPPSSAEAIEWCLLTDQEVHTFEQTIAVVNQYSQRWHIECFHKALKSGFSAEDCRLDSALKLMKFLSLTSILATRIYWAAYLARHEPEQPCTDVLTEIEWRLAFAKANPRKQQPTSIPTIRQAMGWIAQLGGFRGTYKEPGMIVYWRGWRDLQLLVQGAMIMSGIKPDENVSYC